MKNLFYISSAKSINIIQKSEYSKFAYIHRVAADHIKMITVNFHSKTLLSDKF